MSQAVSLENQPFGVWTDMSLASTHAQNLFLIVSCCGAAVHIWLVQVVIVDSFYPQCYTYLSTDRTVLYEFQVLTYTNFGTFHSVGIFVVYSKLIR